MRVLLVILICISVFSTACHEKDNLDINLKDNAISLPIDNNFLIRGTLEFKEIPASKSWDAYDGLEFFIIDKQGLRFPLMESETVSRAQLMDLVGNEIEVEVYPYQPANCPADSFCGSYPVDKSGKQVRRTIRFKVLKVQKTE
jgi:hypothetical protein